MLPDFIENEPFKILPPGIHEATLTEFEKRFVHGIKRQKLFEKLQELILILKRFNCRAIFIDGSYVTNKRLPSDIDVCWDDENVSYEYANLMAPILFKTKEEQNAEFGIDILPAYSHVKGTGGTYFIDYFQIDKDSKVPKGIVKIKIR